MPRALRDLVTRIMIEILHRLNNDTSSHYVFVRFIDQMRGGVASIASFLAFRRLILAQFLSLEPRGMLTFSSHLGLTHGQDADLRHKGYEMATTLQNR